MVDFHTGRVGVKICEEGLDTQSPAREITRTGALSAHNLLRGLLGRRGVDSAAKDP